jgi:signal transduction histidine kinase
MAAGREITAVALKKGHMATAASRAQILNTEKLDRRTAYSRQPALRLLLAERSEEILPILLDEIVRIGYQRAFVAEVDFESGQVQVSAEVNCPPKYTKKFQTFLWTGDDPLVGVLQKGEPAVLPNAALNRRALYCHPIIFRNRTRCWEAERTRQGECLAVLNDRSVRRMGLQEQTCSTCEMRGYAYVVAVDLPKTTSERQLADLRALIELSNRYLTRLFKVEHYYNRMRDMDVVIAQMETVLASMADPVILTDPQHRVITQNKAAERFFSIPENASEGAQRALELNNLLFSAALSSMAMSGTDSSRDLTLVDAKEGEEVLFEAVTAPTYSREGLRTGLVTVMRDVTDLRKADLEVRANLEKLMLAEEVVRQDRDRMSLVIEAVGDPIIVADNAGKPVQFDSLAAQLFGKVGEDVRDQGRVRNLVKLSAYLTAFTFSFGQTEEGKLKLYHPPTDTQIEYNTRSGKILDARGQVSHTVTVLRDLSALRKVEELRVQARMLEMEKFAATGRLAGTIAHEVNNPMEAIKNSIHLLQNRIKPGAEPVYEILKSETDRVARIVRQMLGLYRSSSQIGGFDLNRVIEDTLTLFGRQLERAGVKTELELGSLPPVVGSADQFRQILSNLVVNAKDAMSQTDANSELSNAGNSNGKSLKLLIRTRHLAHGGSRGRVAVTVADTGGGIPPAIRDNMFEPFVSSKGEKGTGLGLWIVRGITESHGGKIRVRSREGEGTVFQIYLPVVRS